MYKGSQSSQAVFPDHGGDNGDNSQAPVEQLDDGDLVSRDGYHEQLRSQGLTPYSSVASFSLEGGQLRSQWWPTPKPMRDTYSMGGDFESDDLAPLRSDCSDGADADDGANGANDADAGANGADADDGANGADADDGDLIKNLYFSPKTIIFMKKRCLSKKKNVG